MTLEILTLFTDEESIPKLEDRTVRFRDASQGMAKAAAQLSEMKSCRSYTFAELPAGHSSSFRVADFGQVAVVLDGVLEVSTGEDANRQLGAGSVLQLLPGATSRHRLSVVGDASVHLMIVQTQASDPPQPTGPA